MHRVTRTGRTSPSYTVSTIFGRKIKRYARWCTPLHRCFATATDAHTWASPQRFMTEKQKKQAFPLDYINIVPVDDIADEELAEIDLQAVVQNAKLTSLTSNAIRRIHNMSDSTDESTFVPTLQVLQCRKIDNKAAGADRFKLVLSDGTHFCMGTIARQLNPLVDSGVFKENSVIKVTNFIINVMSSGGKICIVLGAESAGPHPGRRIGNPSCVTKAGLQKRDDNAAAAGADGFEKPPAKKPKTEMDPIPLTIVGLKWASASAVPGEKVKLVRDPDNQYDSNAIAVVNGSGIRVGHISKDSAAKLAKTMDSMSAKLAPKNLEFVGEGTVTGRGDGYKQPVQVVFKQLSKDGGEVMAEPDSEVAGTLQDSKPAAAAPAPKRKAKCGACGLEGHNRRTATAENCPAFNDPNEVEKRRKSMEKAEAKKLEKAEAKKRLESVQA